MYAFANLMPRDIEILLRQEMGLCLVYVWIQGCFADTCPVCIHTHTHTYPTFVSRSEEFWEKGTVTQFASARKMLPRGLGRLVTQLLTTHLSLRSLVPSMKVFWTPAEGPQAAGRHSGSRGPWAA